MNSFVRRGAILACSCAAAVTGLPAASAGAQDSAALDRYLEQVSVPRIVRHMEAFQRVADANGGTRASGTPGYLRSARYVVGQLRSAGYRPTMQAFDFPFFQQLSPSTFERVSPSPRTFAEDTEFSTMDYSGSGDVTAPVQPVDVILPPPATPGSTSGCEDADFAGFAPGNIALLQRGSCTFAEKVANAAEAGAVAAIIFNEGQPGRTDVVNGTLGGPQPIPAVDTSFEIGNELAGQAAASGVTVHIVTDTVSETRRTWNVIADTTLGHPRQAKTIVVGAHLDSVIEGPGIQDNGSGSAMILELARQLHRIGVAPENRVRFAWWGAEESGLLGSEHYVAQLTPGKLGQIAMNLNFDMVASPNGVRFIYDGDGSDTPLAGPAGSGEIEQAFEDAFGDLPTLPTEFNGRSDYGPFIAQGIPAGGLFTGAEGVKTEEQAAVFGGTAGEWYDPCYHQACDDLANATQPLGLELLDSNSDAAAEVLFGYSQADTLPGAEATAAQTARATAVSSGNGGFGYDLYKGNHLIR